MSLGIGLTLVLSLVSTGGHFFRARLSFQERDWVLLEGFENRTGEAAFDGTLRAALERELSNSEYVNVAPPERVEDALRLMKISTAAQLNRAQAREVCLRDGGIRALVTGRTERAGTTYLLSAEIIDPLRDVTLAADTETAAGAEQVWPAVRRLSNWVRETLGETMERIDRSNRELEKVTTPSLRALQLFTTADSASRQGQWAVSAQLLRQALKEDPDFASARLWLAFALKNVGDQDWKVEAQRALDLADTVSERERYFITGSYQLLMGHPDQALPSFETLVQRYPDHYFGILNLENTYLRLGNVEQAASTAAHLADARPNDPRAVANAAFLNETLNLAKARSYAKRSVALGNESVPLVLRVNTLLFHAHDLWMQDDAAGALRELQRIVSHPEQWSDDPQVQQGVLISILGMYITLGKFQASQELYDRFPDTHVENFPETLSLYRRDTKSDQHDPLLPAWWRNPTFMPAALRQGEISLEQRHYSDAEAVFREQFDTMYARRSPVVLFFSNDLVNLLQQSSHPQQALSVLEKVSASRIWIRPGNLVYGNNWLRNQARLANFYRKTGRLQDAEKIESELRKLLAAADADHPILRQLNAEQR